MDVRGSDQDQGLGDVVDLLVNVDAGQLLYAMVGSGGFLGIGQTTKAVPWEAMQYSAGDNTLILAMTADRVTGRARSDARSTSRNSGRELGCERPPVLADAEQPLMPGAR